MVGKRDGSGGKKDTGLSIALTSKDRGIIDRAARILGLPPSIWARALLLKEAAQVITEAKGAK